MWLLEQILARTLVIQWQLDGQNNTEIIPKACSCVEFCSRAGLVTALIEELECFLRTDKALQAKSSVTYKHVLLFRLGLICSPLSGDFFLLSDQHMFIFKINFLHTCTAQLTNFLWLLF